MVPVNKKATAVILALLFGIAFALATRAADLSWDVERATVSLLTNVPPQLTIVPTKFGPNRPWRLVLSPDGECIGINVTPEQMIRVAFDGADFFEDQDVPAKWRHVVPTNKYDFICNLPHGASTALQEGLRKEFGVAINYQTVTTDVLVLSVRNTSAKELTPLDSSQHRIAKPAGFSGETISDFAGRIHSYFELPIVDNTGLTGVYLIHFNGPTRLPGKEPGPLEAYNKALTEQVGLELKPDRKPVRMLVVEKIH